MRCLHRQPKLRRGATWPAVVWALCVGGTVVTTAVVVTPRYLRAEPALAAVPAREAAHQQVFEAFAGLVSRSKEVVAVNQRGATPFLEFVLWLEDTEHLGVIDPHEIAVLTHSEVLQTITMHTFDPSAARRDARGATEAVETPTALARSDIRAPGFCAGFRDRPGVRRRLIGKRIAHLDAESLVDAVAGRSMLRISLIWDQESADGEDEASALMDVHMRTDEGAQTE